MTSSARFFKSSRRIAVGDIENFYNQVIIGQSDYNKQMIVWRENGSPTAPLQYLIFTRLMFGFRSSAAIAHFGLQKITGFGERNCIHCKGKYLCSFPEKSQGPRCRGTSYFFSEAASRSYVDDLLVPGPSSEALDSMIDLWRNTFKNLLLSHKRCG